MIWGMSQMVLPLAAGSTKGIASDWLPSWRIFKLLQGSRAFGLSGFQSASRIVDPIYDLHRLNENPPEALC